MVANPVTRTMSHNVHTGLVHPPSQPAALTKSRTQNKTCLFQPHGPQGAGAPTNSKLERRKSGAQVPKKFLGACLGLGYFAKVLGPVSKLLSSSKLPSCGAQFLAPPLRPFLVRAVSGALVMMGFGIRFGWGLVHLRAVCAFRRCRAEFAKLYWYQVFVFLFFWFWLLVSVYMLPKW